MKRSRKKGFTLVELLLVLVILATLAAVVVPKFTGRSEQARITAAETQISGFDTALDVFDTDNGRYPDSTEGLNALIDKPGDLDNWRGPYLKKGVPKDPWGNAYMYIYPGRENENGYDLYSFGPDGKKNTDDDITNWSE